MQKTGKIAVLAGVLGLGLAGAAIAQSPPPPPAERGAAEHGRPGEHGWRGHDRGPRGGMGGFALGEAFARADANNDGRVTLDEGRVWLQARFAEVDQNRDGGVTVDEFMAYMQSRRPAGRSAPRPEMLARMRANVERGFRFLDANADGRVTMEELLPVAQAMFRVADANTDGALTREEVMRGGRPAPMPRHREEGAPAAPATPAPPAR